MLLLAFESSCDETAVALMEASPDGSIKVLAERLFSQVDIHKLYGGVVPEIASREHLKALPILVEDFVKDSELNLSLLDAVVVTQGPGLKGCLLMGVCYAKGLAYSLGLPIYGVHHIEGHILVPMLDCPDLIPPYLALVVSGGHTEIVEVKDVGDYNIISRTSDDAAGEAFDKSAYLLGFDYPGGPALAKLADTVSDSRYKLPRVMRESPGFSFSGLKTAISLLVKKNQSALSDPVLKAELAFAVQESIVDALCFKLKKAVEETGISKVAITGGVAANSCLRTAVSQCAPKVFVPKLEHCTDNATMIGYTALVRLARGLELGDGSTVFARSPVEMGMAL